MPVAPVPQPEPQPEPELPPVPVVEATTGLVEEEAVVDDAVPSDVISDSQGENEVDENDPIWIALIKITEGDRKAALKLLEDPDALVSYPEIKEIMDRMDSQDEEILKEVENVSIEENSVNSDDKSPKAATDAPAGDDFVEENETLVDDDPRQHMNLVFIGHVDAGKVRSVLFFFSIM